MKKTLLFFCCIILAPCCSLAEDTSHATPPKHACIRPVHPRISASSDPTAAKTARAQDYDFSTQVDRYKDCIWKYVVGERKAAQLHTSAAENAVEEWYAFIRESIASGVLKER
jgi:hypothetical protein